MTVLGDRMALARRQRFVGRATELAAFAATLIGPRQPTVLHLHGPAGIGKSALLDRMADTAADAGATAIRIDARAMVTQPSALRTAMAAAEGCRSVLLLDSYERCAAQDGWVREQLGATVPADTVIVIGSRTQPGMAWHGDPAWRAATTALLLGPLPPADVHAYLERDGVPAEHRAGLAAMSHGHPLALSLLVAASRAGASPRTWGESPELVRHLRELLVDEPPGPQHRQALEICARTRHTTQSLLRTVMDAGTDTQALFDWLRTHSCIEVGPAGLAPHALARDLIDADLRWRDKDRYDQLHRSVRDHAVAQIVAPASVRETRRRIADAIFLARCHPALDHRSIRLDLDAVPSCPLTADDWPAVVAAATTRHGAGQAELVMHWMKRQPQGFRVFRDGDGQFLGFCCLLDLHEATAGDRDGDPGARVLWEHAQRRGPSDGGGHQGGVLAWRFVVTAPHLDPAAVLPAAVAWRIELAMTAPRPAWELVGVLGDPTAWAPILTYLGFQEDPTDHVFDGTRYAVFGCEWQRMPTAEWIALTADRELGAPADLRPATAAPDPGPALSREEFVDAVRLALRDLHDHHRMATNPLIGARVVQARRDTLPPLNALRLMLELAVDTLRESPRDAVLYTVAVATFLKPAGTQERIAEALHLPFNTYRRHRDRAVARVAEWLWQNEVGNLDAHPTPR